MVLVGCYGQGVLTRGRSLHQNIKQPYRKARRAFGINKQREQPAEQVGALFAFFSAQVYSDSKGKLRYPRVFTEKDFVDKRLNRNIAFYV